MIAEFFLWEREHLKTFRYKAISQDKVKVSGVIKAYDEYEAVTKLRENCSIVTAIEEVKESDSGRLNFQRKLKIKEKELALMCSQFEIIMASGLPIGRCVEMVAAQSKNKKVNKMLRNVAEDIESGHSMSSSFEKNAPTLPLTFIETIRAGEESGTLEHCFAKLHKYYDRQAKMKAKVISTLTYPTIVVAVAIIVFIIIMVVAVPVFVTTFEDMDIELPKITKAMIGFSRFLTGYWWLIIALIIIFIAAYRYAIRTEAGRRKIAEYKLKKSPFHKLTEMNLASQFANTMSTMIAAGMPITSALDITASVVTNYTFSLAIRKVKEGVELGRSLTVCMSEIGLFSSMLTEMTGVGERSGQMEKTFEVVGDYFSNEVEVYSKRLLSILEPAITISLAIIAVVLLLCVYAPMFSMYEAI